MIRSLLTGIDMANNINNGGARIVYEYNSAGYSR